MTDLLPYKEKKHFANIHLAYKNWDKINFCTKNILRLFSPVFNYIVMNSYTFIGDLPKYLEIEHFSLEALLVGFFFF